jgi:hypothetical protein
MILGSVPIFLGALISFSPFTVSGEDADQIGKKIYKNECGSRPEKLTWWNQGEGFASLGIGHFIWYPKGEKGPFEETFPELLGFLSSNNIPLPGWLKDANSSPWNSREEFYETLQQEKKELGRLLSQTVALQAAFILQRFESKICRLFDHLPNEKQEKLSKRVEAIARTVKGKYALIDYLHFKGDGVSTKERYGGYGWGLRQVIEEMPDDPKEPLAAFSESAKAALRRRVENAPPERREERWLPGWLARIESYNH